MLHSKTILKKTKSNKVVKVVREVYLRDDIYCCSQACGKCPASPACKLEADAPEYIVIDTNVVLHQIDLLEHIGIKNVIVLETVLDETKNRSMHTYTRIREITSDKARSFVVFSNEKHKDTHVERLPQESPNDRNDRAIRTATAWYAHHLSSKSIVLVTNDAANKEKALEQGLKAMTVFEYVETLKDQYPELQDIVSHPQEDDQDNKYQFTEYLSKSAIETGIKNGSLFQGVLRMNRDNWSEGHVQVEAMEEDILVSGISNLNRAIDGDIVAVQLLPKEQWTRPSSILQEIEEMEDDEMPVDGIEDIKPSTEEDANNENPKTAPVNNSNNNNNNTETGERMKPSGKIVAVIKANWKPYCGSIDSNTVNKNGFVLFCPVNKKIPKIRIRTRQLDNLIRKRIVVAIDTWDLNSRYPSGHYVRTLGATGDKEVETEVVLIQHDIPYHPFSEAVLQCLPSPDWQAFSDPDSKSAHRRDLTHLCICSVDPPGCTDIDDALHVRQLDNGNIEVGVHIADVTHFVHENTPLDAEAADRCTTVYLVNKRIDMLPKLLGENLCSLMSNVDRFAFSVIWEMTPEAEVVSVEYCKSIIRSRASLTYEQAQLRIDDKRMNDELTVGLRHLLALSKLLKKKRIEAGALMLASPEVKFIKDEQTQEPVDVEMYQLRETNSMVEEFMLLANIYTAKKIYDTYPSFAILRRHPAPNPKQFRGLIELLKRFDVTLKLDTSKELADSLDNLNISGEPYYNTLIRIMTTRCMQPAEYFSSGSVAKDLFHHYGLAVDIYTHFTSPIRRYADVIVHRLLGCAIGVYSLSVQIDNKKIQKIADVINRRHKMAQYAQRSSVELHTWLFFKGKVFHEEAYVTRIKSNAIVVLIPRYGVESNVYLKEAGKEGTNTSVNFIFNEKEGTLTFPTLNTTLRVFDKVGVEISVDEDKQQMRILCFDPPIHATLQSPTIKITRQSELKNVPLPNKPAIEAKPTTPNKPNKKPLLPGDQNTVSTPSEPIVGTKTKSEQNTPKPAKKQKTANGNGTPSNGKGQHQKSPTPQTPIVQKEEEDKMEEEPQAVNKDSSEPMKPKAFLKLMKKKKQKK